MFVRIKISTRNTKYFRLFSSFRSPEIDTDYYCNIKNIKEIEQNVRRRKGSEDVNRIIDMYNTLQNVTEVDKIYHQVRDSLFKELIKLPNKTHPSVLKYKDEAELVHTLNAKRDFGDHAPLEFNDIVRRLNLMRTDKLGHTCDHKSYFLFAELAELEEALIKYTVTSLIKENFHLVSVPDILPKNVLENCGMEVNTDRTQIYSLDPVHYGPDLHLSGTAEMSLASLLKDSHYTHDKLPLKLAAVSRCYRSETSNLLEERGIYRVHQFTKVEMFIVSSPEQSDDMLEYVRNVQEKLFLPLNIHMRVLDMPPHDLGRPAYRKYDIEAWMPGRGHFGEISSCSNCTDYQARRLHMKFSDKGTNDDYVHTLNGTACAIPRMLIALLETHQQPKGKILIPEILQPYMNGKIFITNRGSVPQLKLKK